MKTIKECRKKARISIAEIAKMMAVDESQYGEMECYNKEMTIEQGLMFSRITNNPIDEIIFFAK